MRRGSIETGSTIKKADGHNQLMWKIKVPQIQQQWKNQTMLTTAQVAIPSQLIPMRNKSGQTGRSSNKKPIMANQLTMSVYLEVHHMLLQGMNVIASGRMK